MFYAFDKNSEMPEFLFCFIAVVAQKSVLFQILIGKVGDGKFNRYEALLERY